MMNIVGIIIMNF
jgi:hypothetical protein